VVASTCMPPGDAASECGSTTGIATTPLPAVGAPHQCPVEAEHTGAAGRQAVEVGLPLPGQRRPGLTAVGGLDESDKLTGGPGTGRDRPR
jgi:hypothetical protein